MWLILYLKSHFVFLFTKKRWPFFDLKSASPINYLSYFFIQWTKKTFLNLNIQLQTLNIFNKLAFTNFLNFKFAQIRIIYVTFFYVKRPQMQRDPDFLVERSSRKPPINQQRFHSLRRATTLLRIQNASSYSILAIKVLVLPFTQD